MKTQCRVVMDTSLCILRNNHLIFKSTKNYYLILFQNEIDFFSTWKVMSVWSYKSSLRNVCKKWNGENEFAYTFSSEIAFLVTCSTEVKLTRIVIFQ